MVSFNKEELQVRKNFEIFIWIKGQIRPFILSFIMIIVLNSILSLCGVGMAVLSKNLIDSASAGDRSRMINVIIAFAAIILLQVGLQMVISPMTAGLQEKLSNRIRRGTFAHIITSEWEDFSRYHSGELLTRLTRDIGMMVNIIVNSIPGIFSFGVGLLAAFGTLFIYEPVLALFAFVLGPAALLLSRLFGRRIKKFHVEMQESEGAYRSFIHESIQNLLIIKAFGLEEKTIGKIGRLQNNMVNLVLGRSRVSAATNSVLSIGYWLGYFFAFGWGVLRLSDGEASFGTLAAFLQLVGQIHGPFIGLAYTYPRLVSAMASAGRLMEIEGMKTEARDYEAKKWPSAGIVFEDVSFFYEEEKPVLKEVSAEIKPGETIALMGPSGDGKTTLIRLILSFIKPRRGRVFFENAHGEYMEACAASRLLVSYVPQGNTLFSGTISENLRLGYPGASEVELKAAAVGACAWEFIEKLPEGLNTIIGERGLGLSEGQAQRIAIARALLHKAPVLILDEATSALDAETEKRVLLAIKGLSNTPTCIVITHRPSALEICSRVMRLQEGRLVECGGGAIEAAASQEV